MFSTNLKVLSYIITDVFKNTKHGNVIFMAIFFVLITVLQNKLFHQNLFFLDNQAVNLQNSLSENMCLTHVF